MKGGDYNNQVFKQLQEVLKKCDDLSHEIKENKKEIKSINLKHEQEIFELKEEHKKKYHT